MNNDRNKELSNLIMDSMRLLILISKFEYRKTFKLTLDKIMLYDFYMKFPDIMLTNKEEREYIDSSFEDVYSYYHWKPNQDQYISTINYLISKKLIIRNIEDSKFCYLITDLGEEFISGLTSKYKIKLDSAAKDIRQMISKLSDDAVEKDILEKINLVKNIKG